MAKITTDRIKFNAPLGNLPALQYLLPAQLKVDESYQRSIETKESQGLIRKIAQYWNWDLCQPLVVARRDNGELFVIDGQHRLEAARLRGDIAQLPAVVVAYASAADEAASFVHLNQQRRPLTTLQVFHAAVASGDSEASAIVAAIEGAGLRLGKSSQLDSSPPMTINNVGGIQRAWRRQGAEAASEALKILAGAFAGQKLVYAGSIYPGIVALIAHKLRESGPFSPANAEKLQAMLAQRGQLHWRTAMLRVKSEYPALNFPDASAKAIGDAWAKTTLPQSFASAAPAPVSGPVSGAARPIAPTPPPASVDGFKPGLFKLADRAWCDQCDAMVTRSEAARCKSRHCALKVQQAA